MTYPISLSVDDSCNPDLTGWRRWVFSTNHKDIGSMYLAFSIVGGLVGEILSVVIRMELAQPGMQIIGADHQLPDLRESHPDVGRPATATP